MAQKNMRTRNLDHSKPMVIYDATKDDLPDRMDHQGVVRTTNILPTGIEKEEETEHHLQLALSAVQSGNSMQVAIPIPDVKEIESVLHDVLYPSGYQKEKELYRVQGLSSGPEPDVVDYCIDEADNAWIKETGVRLGISFDRFESAIDRLEKATGAQFMSESDAVKLLKDRAETVTPVYNYWITKRRRLGHALISRVRTETKRDSGSGHDPYVAFRRRAEKMQTRKNRKSDEQNYILMFKMRIAHTQLMRDGLMDILKGIRERETLKLRTSLMERQEYQISNILLDDPAGQYQNHLLDSYPELNKIEEDSFGDLDYGEGEVDASELANEEADSLEEFSEVSDSGNESDSWSNLHRTDLKNRSPHFDLEHDENAGNFAAAAPADPNLVPESQYKGEEPPEYWGPDGEFTFVPRRDCKYLQPKIECDIGVNRLEDPLRGFFLQEIPVIVGRITVMKTVLGRRTYGLNGTKRLEYYKLPDCLDALELELLLKDAAPLPEECLAGWKSVFSEKTETIYVHLDKAIKEEYPLPEDPIRWNLTEEDVEDLFQAALRWPLDTECTATGAVEEDDDLYQIACTSVCEPLLEHNYCKHPVYGNLDWLEDIPHEMDVDDAGSHLETTSTDMGSVESTEGGSQSADPSPPMSLEGDLAVQALSLVPLSVMEAVNGKRKAPAIKKPKAGKLTDSLALTAAGTGAGLKRMKPEALVVGSNPGLGKELAAPKKPPRKRAKPNVVVDVAQISPQQQSENTVKIFDAFQIPMVPPLVPPSGVTGGGIQGKKMPVKRKSPQMKKAGSLELIKGDIQNGDIAGLDAFPSKKPKRRPPAPKKGKDDVGLVNLIQPNTPMPLPLFSADPKARPILPVGSAITSMANGPVTVSAASLTFSPSPLRMAAPLNGTGPRLATYGSHPNLQSLLASANGTVSTGGLVTNGYHNSVGANSVVQNGMNLGVVVHTPKLC